MTSGISGASWQRGGLSWEESRPAHALELLEALRVTPSGRCVQRFGLSLATTVAGRPAVRLAPATVNRVRRGRLTLNAITN